MLRPLSATHYGKLHDNTVISRRDVLPSVEGIIYFHYGDCHGGRKYSVSHGVIIHHAVKCRRGRGGVS
jgi:hypothetical protein